MNNECMCSEKNKNIFYQFFENFVQILATSKLYLEDDIENSSIIVDDDINGKPADNTITINVKKGLYSAYEELKNIPNEFIKVVTNCHNFISLVLFSVDQRIQIDEEEEDNIIDENMLNLLHIFVTAFNILHEVNEYYSIIDYKQFYNDSISKYLNMGREFKKYLKKIKQLHKEKEKLIGAYNSGYKNIYLPIDNQGDVSIVPDEIKNRLNIKFVSNYEEIFNDLFKKSK